MTTMHKYWRPLAECFVACVALVLLTIACYILHLNLTTASLLDVIVVVAVSRFGRFIPSIGASIFAALCLAYLAPPAFSFRVDDPFDVVAILAFMIVSFTIASLVSKTRQQAEDARSSVTYRVIEAEERERRRIANDLHEDIGQRLTMLGLEINQVKADTRDPTFEMSNRMDALSKQTLNILTDVKTLAHELYSPRLEYLGIAGVMGSFCRDFAIRRGVEIEFTSEGVPNAVSPDITLCLFRVLQEALQNAVAHSGARHFDGRLWGTSDEIQLTVSDCGAGFDLERESKDRGLGLNRMQERLKLVNGTLSIESRPDRGTTIHASVPVSLGSKT